MSLQSMLLQSKSPQISQLFVYPIKSCAGISVSHFKFDKRGPLFDRRWMLVDAKTGIFLSQRELPKMALISTRIENDRVWASFKNANKSLELPVEGDVLDVNIWSDNVQGFDCGNEAANWFSRALGCECRLVYQGGCERLADTDYVKAGTEVSYADGFPLLVVAQASIQLLNAACDTHIDAENFRPNIVITNTAAFAELKWQDLSTSTVAMTVVKPCQRCVIPTLNPKTAEREKGILTVLLEHCRRDKKIYFGQNLTFEARDNTIDQQDLELAVNQMVTISSIE